MAATVLTPTAITRSGISVLSGALTAADGSNGNKWVNTGSQFFLIDNAGGSNCTASFAIAQTVDGVTPAAKTVTVVHPGRAIVGPFPTPVYNDTSSYVTVTYDQVSSVTVGVYTFTASG